MIKVIKNGTVITMNSDKEIGKLDIVIKDNNIIEIVKNYTGYYDEIIDATNMVVMPGLINCHAHLGMSLFRNTNDGLNLGNWLNNKIFPIEDKMTGQDMYYTTLLSCIEMIKTGTTCVSDMYFNWEEVISSIEKCKIRCLFSRCINDPDDKYDKRVKEFIDLIEYTKTNKNDLLTLSVSAHSLYTCSEKCLIECKKLADKYDLPIHIHFCENKDEVEIIKKRFNMTPIKVLEKLGYLNNKLILAHGVFLESDNLNLLNRPNIYVCHNIISNLNLGCGILPLKKYKDSGINICLGTDGQGSGLNMNMFSTIAFTSLVSKGLYKDALNTNSYDILKYATIDGATALGLEKKVGSIEVGKCADIIILNLKCTEIYPINNLISEIVHNVNPNNIKYTIINGEILLKDGKLNIDVDENILMEKIDSIIERINLN